MTDGLIIETKDGWLSGVRQSEVNAFLGVPFAAPPTGLRRGQPPQPTAPWAGVRAATRFGRASLQPTYPLMPTHSTDDSDEDCLYLNLWSPVGADGLPVLVLIHGGGFQIGSGAAPAYRGDRLAASGLVVVTFNYRLGALGFDQGPLWIQDQIAALQWVQRNIRAFGGDPERVTLAGMSAGGVSVNALNLSPRARGLFSQALIISGGGDSLFSPSPSPPPLPLSSEGLAPMRSPAFGGGRGEAPGMDGTFIAQLPSEALTQGVSNARRIMVGYSSFEGSLLNNLAIPPDLMAQALGGPALFPNADGYDLYGELIFRRPANDLALLAARGPAEVWQFDYGYVPQALRGLSRGASHGAALYALLETLEPAYSELACEPKPADLKAAADFRERVVAFVSGGPPDRLEGPGWPALTPDFPRVLQIGADGAETVIQVHDLLAGQSPNLNGTLSDF